MIVARSRRQIGAFAHDPACFDVVFVARHMAVVEYANGGNYEVKGGKRRESIVMFVTRSMSASFMRLL